MKTKGLQLMNARGKVARILNQLQAQVAKATVLNGYMTQRVVGLACAQQLLKLKNPVKLSVLQMAPSYVLRRRQLLRVMSRLGRMM
ncbi:MAG: hypothetical protein A3J25_03860 [Pseudomonadales bacterium RIFCSPLOWO2_02_FULL_63_210]|nr:MAG: hypothetical protein A3J25_03860 [Pseudomonadales bacterium RIFCSPLOWO2_02_FULL_63_210]